MIGVTPPSSDATLHVIEGGLIAGLRDRSRARPMKHPNLIWCWWAFVIFGRGLLGRATRRGTDKRLGYLIAHRPGLRSRRR